MKRLTLAALLALGGCSATQLAATTANVLAAGGVFCAVQLAGGGTVVVAAISAVAPAVNGPAAPTVILVAGATKAFVDAACKAAAASIPDAKAAFPVSPPADPVAAPRVAIVPPAAS